MYQQIDIDQLCYDEAINILENTNHEYINEQNPMYQHFMVCMKAEEIKAIITW